MRSRSYCAISSVVLVSACLAGDPKADAKVGEVHPADYKQEDRKEESKGDYGEHGSGDEAGTEAGTEAGAPRDMETGEAVPEPIPCPKDEGRMEDGSCAPEEEFFGEQETLDAEALAQLQVAHDAKAQAEAQEKFIQQQIRQANQAEKGLDEIIKDLKQKKKAKGDLGDPFGEDGKEGL